jgi:hypothetical protein
MTTDEADFSLQIAQLTVEKVFDSDCSGILRQGVEVATFSYARQRRTLTLGHNRGTLHGEPLGDRLAEVSIEVRSQPFGGVRYWFRCPGCGRRCAILYLPSRPYSFACRWCYGLRYYSQRTDFADRMHRAAARLCRRFGVSGGLAWDMALDGLPPKPRGMHWSTYHHLEAKWTELIDRRDEWFQWRPCRLLRLT